MFEILMKGLLLDSGVLLDAGVLEDCIPGSSVAPGELEEVLDKTTLIEQRLSKFSAIHAEALKKLIPAELTVVPVSEGLQGLNTKAIITALHAVKDGAAALAAQFPGSASGLGAIATDVDQVLQKWQAIVNADLENEEVEFKLYLSLRGPKCKMEKVKAAVAKAADDAIIMAVIELRLGIDPDRGDLVVLDPQDPQHLECISITGDALKQRVCELGGTIVSDSEVREFIAEHMTSSAVSDDADEDCEDDELEDDAEVELDEEQDEEQDEVESQPLS
jgi:hypothetical protein